MTEFKKLSLRSGIALALALLVSSNVLAQEGRSRADNSDNEPAASAGTIDERTGGILTKAIEFLNMEQYAEARATLAELRLDRLSPFERSRYEQLMINLDLNDENYPSARQHMQAAIDSGGLNPQEVSAIRYQMAQLFVQEEKYAEAAQALEAWIAVEPMPNSGAYYLLAASYYYQELWDKALPPAYKAVELGGEKPQEGWLTMLASLLMTKEDYAAALPVVKRTVNLYPDKKNYWIQLYGLYAQQEDFVNGLVVLEFANHAGMLTEDRDIRQLSDLYMVQEMPYRAAILLESALADGKVEKNLKAYESLANSWIAAREFEKAIPVLADAADLSDDGEIFRRIGEVHQQLGNWEGSAEAFQDALDKGGLRDAPYIEYLLGYSLYELERFDEARTHLQRAARDEEQRTNSNNLIRVIESRDN